MIAALFKISLVSLLISLKWNQGNKQNCSALATFFEILKTKITNVFIITAGTRDTIQVEKYIHSQTGVRI